MTFSKSSGIFALLLFVKVVLGHEIPKVRAARQTWQWPSGRESARGSGGLSRSDASEPNSAFFQNFFNKNFQSFSPFASFSFQPSFANSLENSPASSGDSFSRLADSFGSRQQPPKVDNFLVAGAAPSWTNILPQQRPASSFIFSPAPNSGSIFSPSQSPIKFQMPSTFPSSLPSQSWDGSGTTSASDLQSQINSIFKQNGMWTLPQNFVQDKINEAWTKSTQQFGGSTAALQGQLPTTFSSLQFGSPGSQSDMFAGTQPASLAIAKNAFTLEDFSKSLSKELNLNRSTAASTLPLVTIAPAATVAPTAPTPAQSVFSFQPIAPSASPAAPSFPDCQGQEKPVVPIGDFLKAERQPACAKNKYRSHTGECNNICFPTRGKASTVFIRLIGPDYADGISEPRRNSRNRLLPSARLVSSSLIGTKVRLAPTWTNMFMQFGQFLVRDRSNC